jgi:hypothetical protein
MVTEDNTILCTICNESQDTIGSLLLHMMVAHPEFFVASMSYLNLLNDEIYEEENDYEYWSNICDSIGNHYVGLSKEKIDLVAPINIIDEECDCAICLEKITVDTQSRKLTLCSHIYCSTCIETWLSQHRTCPICKCELADADSPLTINVEDVD